MKNLLSTFFFALIILSNTSCNTEEKEIKEDILPEGWITLDLSEPGTSFGMPFLLNIPGTDIAKGEALISEGPMGGTQIVVGNNFNIEILPANIDINQKKIEIESDGIFQITYLVDQEDLLIYKTELPGGEGLVLHHFATFIRVGNVIYEITDVKDGEFNELAIKTMAESAKTLKIKPTNEV